MKKELLLNAMVYLIWALVCVVSIAVYGSFRPEGTTVDLIVAWGLVALGFVLLSLGFHNLHKWSDA